MVSAFSSRSDAIKNVHFHKSERQRERELERERERERERRGILDVGGTELWDKSSG